MEFRFEEEIISMAIRTSGEPFLAGAAVLPGTYFVVD